MKKEKNIKKINDDLNEEKINEILEDLQDNLKDNNEALNNDNASEEVELENIKVQLEEKSKKCEEYYNMLQRTVADFDNFKKRSTREKEALYQDSVSDVVAAFLPVVDNMERALQASGKEDEGHTLKEGIDLVFRQIKDVMKNLGVEEIKCINENFDPELHNAVMHIEDEECGENTVVEEFQKGYIFKDKVIRHSMVKVAN